MTTTTARKRELNKRHYVKNAVQHFTDNLPGRFKGRAEAIKEIKNAARPLTTAKRLVRHYRTTPLDGAGGGIDHSDVQEIRARLIRRDHIIDAPQAAALARMDHMISTGAMTATTLKRMASAVIGMRSALTKEIRKAERQAVMA